MGILSTIGSIAKIAGPFVSSMLGAKANRTARRVANENLAFQKMASQMGIQWRVADAKKAGINPLATMGAQTFSPVPVGVSQQNVGDYGLSAAGNAMVGRKRAGNTEESRIRLSQEREALRGLRLQNDLLERQAYGPVNPARPIPQSTTSSVLDHTNRSVDVPRETISKQDLGTEAGAAALESVAYDKSGNQYRLIGDGLEEKVSPETSVPNWLIYNMRQIGWINRVSKAWLYRNPSDLRHVASRRPSAPPGMMHVVSPITGQWKLVKYNKAEPIFSKGPPTNLLLRSFIALSSSTKKSSGKGKLPKKKLIRRIKVPKKLVHTSRYPDGLVHTHRRR